MDLAGSGDFGRGRDLVHGCAQDPFQTTIGMEQAMAILRTIWRKMFSQRRPTSPDAAPVAPLHDLVLRGPGVKAYWFAGLGGKYFSWTCLHPDIPAGVLASRPVQVDMRLGHDSHGGNPYPTQRRCHSISGLRSGCGRFPPQPAQRNRDVVGEPIGPAAHFPQVIFA